LEDYWTYHTQIAGNKGIGYVNDFSGNLVFVQDLGLEGADFPLGMEWVYNGYLAGMQFNAYHNISNVFNGEFGKGWQLSCVRILRNVGTETEPLYQYTDADGTDHYFQYNDVTEQYEDEDGLGYVLTVGTSTLTLTDSSDIVTVFNNGLIQTVTYDEKTYTYHYTENKLVRIQNEAQDTVFSFGYTGNALTAVTDGKSNTATVSYASGLLTEIESGDGESLVYSYDMGLTRNPLASVSSEKQNKKLVYDSVYWSGGTLRVTRITEVYDPQGDAQAGESIKISYPQVRTTVYESSGTDDCIDTTADNLLSVYQFDYDGKTVNVHTTDYSGTKVYDATTVSYAADNTDTFAVGKNNVQTLATSGGGSKNYLRNGNFESYSIWTTKTYGDPIENVMSWYKIGESFIGDRSYEIRVLSENNSTYGLLQSVTLEAGTYTLSSYVKTDYIGNTSVGGALLAIYNGNTRIARSERLVGQSNRDIQNGWRRVSVTFHLLSQTTVDVFLGIESVTGYVLFDGAQLEKGESYNPYNLLENSSFITAGGSWTLENATWQSAAGKFSPEALQLSGKLSSRVAATQTVTLEAKAGTTYVVSGWAKGRSISVEEDPKKEERKFGIEVVLHYANEESEAFYFAYNAHHNDWQYLTASVIPGVNEVIASATVSFVYVDNYNTVLIDDFALTAQSVYDLRATESEEGEGGGEEEEEGEEADPYPAFEVIGELRYDYTYDSQNRVIGTKISYVGESCNMNANKAYYTSQTYDADGNVLTETDERGLTTSYAYVNGLLSSVTDASGREMRYTYNDAKELIKMAQTVGGSEVANEYAYDSHGRLTGLTGKTDSSVNQAYTFTYDVYGNLSEVLQNGQVLVSYTYNGNNGKLVSMTYANGFVESYGYDALDRLTILRHNGVEKSRYVYDRAGLLLSVETVGSGYSNNGTIDKYEYDQAGRNIRKYQVNTRDQSIAYTKEWIYDSEGKEKKLWYRYGDGEVYEYNYIYNEKGDLVRERVPNVDNEIGENFFYHERDAFGRTWAFGIDKWRVYEDENGDPVVRFSHINGWNEYKYLPGDSSKQNATTDYIGEEYYADKLLAYTYDEVGNITAITKDGQPYVSYEYDGLGQLVRENNTVSGKTYVYTYDLSGNIQRKYTLNYDATTPLASLNLGSQYTEYTYGDSGNGDKLTEHNGQAIPYDAMGNPLKWRDWKNLDWTGRQLDYILMEDYTTAWDYEEVTFTYNAEGVRTKKTYFSDTSQEITQNEYILDGDRVLREIRNYSYMGYPNENTETTITYYYNLAGEVIGLRYLDADYYYAKNMQGDILEIYDMNGNLCVTYAYDAWGNILSIGGSMKYSLGRDNPFRYRSYYYDVETGLFYVGSRYYDPEVGRFLNGDEPSVLQLIHEEILGSHFYAYCYNNPVSYYDPDGRTPLRHLYGILNIGSGNYGIFNNTTLSVRMASIWSIGYMFKYLSACLSTPSKMPKDLKMLIAMVAGEALSTHKSDEWISCAYVAINRVGKYEWKNWNLNKVLNKTHFKAVGKKLYNETLNWISKGCPELTEYFTEKDVYWLKHLMIYTVLVYYTITPDITGGAVFFSRGKASFYGRETFPFKGTYHRFFMYPQR
jgi:RHS repeat-associated protein